MKTPLTSSEMGKKSRENLRKKLGKKGMSEFMSKLAKKKHGKDKPKVEEPHH